ncbi:sigma-70 family RNA polymerase sigma factor [Saccharothrix australiensis]|uniref:RNA polymerase sigma factor n=1 Tax=Saccharothrix australiensis TaxID=2072 RepID=A0A495W6P9_9PSEU|nr:sigma-70 family RNA polymerase sigma factor [Saccharothrix australiensis]RKT55478.1 RNA polymerase primary sigma factor/RNA polymerase nonessential primary-like sigma factor [Saccharothrix australiensis]
MSSTMETPRRPRTAASGRREWSPDADLVGHYLREVGATPLLTAEQEVALARRIEAGVYAAELLRRARDGEEPQPDAERARGLRAVVRDGEQAKEHMILANLRLVVSVAKKHSYRGLPFLDVVQEGNLGLIRAVEKFDYAKGYKFSTYAIWWIRQAIERGLADQTRTVRLPVHVVEELNRTIRAEQRLRRELDREPTEEEVAAAARVPVARLLELRQAGRTVISLETPVGDDGNSSVADLIEDVDAVRAHEVVEQAELTAELNTLVKTLPERQARIMRRRYGLDDGRPCSLQEIARELGLTRERIRQLEKESLRLLRDTERNRAVLELAG